jgi:hypothetical protein
MFSIAAVLTALALVPAVAIAQRGHHKRHHARVHARIRHFGPASTTAPTSANAGTVKSFTGGVLTLALHNGSTVSGTVDNNTEIECGSVERDLRSDGESGQSGSGSGDRGDQRDDIGTSDDDNGNNGDDNDENGHDNGDCTTSALSTSAVVRSAELRISSAGAVWDKVELGT